MEDWAEIRRLHRAEGVPIKEIARLMGLARNTVRTAVRADEPPSYKRKARGSGVDVHEPAIRRLLADFPRMPATVIAERIGWTGGRTVFRARVAELVRSTCRLTPASAPTTAPVNWPSGTCGSPSHGSLSTMARKRCCRSSSGCRATPG